MAIRIKRSSGDQAPASLAAGQMAYVEGATNGGTLYYGEIGGTVREIAGKKYIDKLNGIQAGAEVNAVDSVAGKTGAVTLVAADITDFGAEVDARVDSGLITDALGFTPENTSNKGQAGGYASLDLSGKVPALQLPSYVDDVIERDVFANLPATGETGIIYVTTDNNKTYRWSGSTYIEISPSPGSTDSLSEGSTNKYFTDARARAAISVTQNLSYNNSTGVITGPDLSSYLTTVALNDVSDVNIMAPVSTGQVLKYNGISGNWENSTLSFLTNIGEDASPTLGGNLNVSSYSITGPVNSNISISPTGTGKVVISGLSYPNSDGTSGQVLSTNGSGVLSWTTASGFSGDYNDLTNKPTLFSGAYNDLTGKPTLFSGSYTDLTDKPTLFSGAYADLTGKPTLVTAFTGLSDVPSLYTGFGSAIVRVKSDASGLEFTSDLDDGTF